MRFTNTLTACTKQKQASYLSSIRLPPGVPHWTEVHWRAYICSALQVHWSAYQVPWMLNWLYAFVQARSALKCRCNYLNEEEVHREFIGSALEVHSFAYVKCTGVRLECAGSVFVNISGVRWSALQCAGSAFISIPEVHWSALQCARSAFISIPGVRSFAYEKCIRMHSFIS